MPDANKNKEAGSSLPPKKELVLPEEFDISGEIRQIIRDQEQCEIESRKSSVDKWNWGTLWG